MPRGGLARFPTVAGAQLLQVGLELQQPRPIRLLQGLAAAQEQGRPARLSQAREFLARLQGMQQAALAQQGGFIDTCAVVQVDIRPHPLNTDVVTMISGGQRLPKLLGLKDAIGVPVPVPEPALRILEHVRGQAPDVPSQSSERTACQCLWQATFVVGGVPHRAELLQRSQELDVHHTAFGADVQQRKAPFASRSCEVRVLGQQMPDECPSLSTGELQQLLQLQRRVAPRSLHQVERERERAPQAFRPHGWGLLAPGEVGLCYDGEVAVPLVGVRFLQAMKQECETTVVSQVSHATVRIRERLVRTDPTDVPSTGGDPLPRCDRLKSSLVHEPLRPSRLPAPGGRELEGAVRAEADGPRAQQVQLTRPPGAHQRRPGVVSMFRRSSINSRPKVNVPAHRQERNIWVLLVELLKTISGRLRDILGSEIVRLANRRGLLAGLATLAALEWHRVDPSEVDLLFRCDAQRGAHRHRQIHRMWRRNAEVQEGRLDVFGGGRRRAGAAAAAAAVLWPRLPPRPSALPIETRLEGHQSPRSAE
mmetsp:Transcript_84512/g.244305  ORF Transcript_84512/g.244305 Transcript_84512/m.244305 type:complete len:536 (+) Transcript_84512:1432-3039(+)